MENQYLFKKKETSKHTSTNLGIEERLGNHDLNILGIRGGVQDTQMKESQKARSWFLKVWLVMLRVGNICNGSLYDTKTQTVFQMPATVIQKAG